MSRTRSSTSFAPQRLAASGLAWLLVAAVLWMQMLGLTHRTLHGVPGAGLHAVSVAPLADTATQAGKPVQDLLGHLLAPQGHGPECQLYDHLGQPDGLLALPLALPAVLPALRWVAPALAQLVVAPPAAYAARAPPALR